MTARLLEINMDKPKDPAVIVAELPYSAAVGALAALRLKRKRGDAVMHALVVVGEVA